MQKRLSVFAACALSFLTILSGCQYVRPTLNAPLKQWDPQYGYQFSNLAPPEEGNTDSFFFIAAFSGGGTRASALAYGALRELAGQRIRWEGKDKRLLDELDLIQALSGGTFTGAYYALFGDRIFQDFESRFLRKDWDSELRGRILRSPSNWFRLWSPYYGRAHIMADLLNEALFDGKTYGDLVQQRSRPALLIHASDMATLARFEFRQSQFDAMCSDLSQLPIAYASAASAALPLVLSPITLKNYAGQCGYQPPAWLLEAGQSKNMFQRQRAKELLSFLDIEKRPYVHLLDGGLSDNVALRGTLEGVSVRGGIELALKIRVKQVQKLVILAVNAETSPDVKDYRSDEIPVFSRAFSSLVDIPINRYSTDTLLLLRFAVEMWRKNLLTLPEKHGDSTSAGCRDLFYRRELWPSRGCGRQQYLMKIPTTLYLTDEQLDRLFAAASRLIRSDPEFQRLMSDLQRNP